MKKLIGVSFEIVNCKKKFYEAKKTAIDITCFTNNKQRRRIAGIWKMFNIFWKTNFSETKLFSTLKYSEPVKLAKARTCTVRTLF